VKEKGEAFRRRPLSRRESGREDGSARRQHAGAGGEQKRQTPAARAPGTPGCSSED